MGLFIEVGILADLRENDEEGYEYSRKQFELLNTYLNQVGLPRHDEPNNCEIWGCAMYGYSGLHYIRRLAAHLDCGNDFPPPGDEESSNDVILQNYYKEATRGKTNIIQGFFNRPLKYKFGFDHLILHSDSEGLYVPIEFDKVLFPSPDLGIVGGMLGSTVKLLQECELLASALEIPSNINEKSDDLGEAPDLQGEAEIKWQKYGVESFTCVHLIKACRQSIKTGAAIVFT